MNPERTVNDPDSTGAISEMAIVDTFTRLIFGEQGEPDPRDRLIIDAFRDIDPNVLLDGPEEMGEYLRALGVREMIQLVASIHAELAGRERRAGGEEQQPATARRGASATRH